MSLANKLAVVSGGSGTVGSGTCTHIVMTTDNQHAHAGIIKAFLEAGASVIAPVRSDRAKASLIDELGGTQPDALDIVTADVGSDAGASALADHIRSAHSGTVDYAVSSCGAWWQGGALSTVSLEDFKTQQDNLTTGHFLLYKHLINLLPDDSANAFVFITGGAGAHCFMPQASMVTVGAAGAFGIALAAFAEQQAAARRVVEARITALIRRDKAEQNDNFSGAPSFSHLVLGRHVVNLAQKAEQGTVVVGAEQLGDS